MLRIWTWLFFSSFLAAAQEGKSVPEILSESVALIESPSPQSERVYTLSLSDRLRERHFAFVVDRSACKGDLFVNDQKLLNDDADEVFSFDRANRIRLEGCLERTPQPISLYAHPRVLIEEVRAFYRAGEKTLRMEVRLRNTLANSVTVTLTAREAPGWEENFFLGPQTSQTRSLELRLDKYRARIQLELLKYEEALEGPYRHIRVAPITR